MLLKIKSRSPRKVEKKRGAPKMKVHPDMCMITKDLKSDTLPYPEMCMKTIMLNRCMGRFPEMLMQRKELTA